MPKLNCGVQDCYYYAEGLCSKHAIKVMGTKSRKKKETKCQTYVPKTNGSFVTEFARLGIYATPDTDVYCTAKNCVYHDMDKCTADQIEVSDDMLNSKPKETLGFDTKTMCKTFEPKEDIDYLER